MAISQNLILPLTKVGQNCIGAKVLCFSSLFATKRRGGTRRGIRSRTLPQTRLQQRKHFPYFILKQCATLYDCWQPILAAQRHQVAFFLISDERCVNEIASIFFLLYLCRNTGQSQVLISRKMVQNGLSLVQVKITYLIYSETYLVFNLFRYKDQYLDNQNQKIDSNFKVVYLQLS